MAQKDEDHAHGLAERSLNTSIVHSSRSSPHTYEQGDRILPENHQREGMEKSDPDRKRSSNRHEP